MISTLKGLRARNTVVFVAIVLLLLVLFSVKWILWDDGAGGVPASVEVPVPNEGIPDEPTRRQTAAPADLTATDKYLFLEPLLRPWYEMEEARSSDSQVVMHCSQEIVEPNETVVFRSTVAQLVDAIDGNRNNNNKKIDINSLAISKQQHQRHGLSLVIPMVDRDMHVIAPMLESVAAQTKPPEEIAVFVSAISTRRCAQILHVMGTSLASLVRGNTSKRKTSSAAATSSSVLVICTRVLRMQSQARNCAASLARGELLSFFDADDIMHPQRMELLIFAQRFVNARLVLHLWTDNPKDMEQRHRTDKLPDGTMDGVQLHDIASKDRTVVWLPTGLPVQHAHSTMPREVWERDPFPTARRFYRSEDSRIVRAIVKRYGRHRSTALALKLPLSLYTPREYRKGEQRLE